MGFNLAFKELINGYNISEPAVPSSSILCRHTTTNCGQSVTLRLVPCRSVLYEETSAGHRKFHKNNTFIARFQVFRFWLRFTSPVTWLGVVWLISDDSWELATCKLLCLCNPKKSRGLDRTDPEDEGSKSYRRFCSGNSLPKDVVLWPIPGASNLWTYVVFSVLLTFLSEAAW